jgi:hypothetical protein
MYIVNEGMENFKKYLETVLKKNTREILEMQDRTSNIRNVGWY